MLSDAVGATVSMETANCCPSVSLPAVSRQTAWSGPDAVAVAARSPSATPDPPSSAQVQVSCTSWLVHEPEVYGVPAVTFVSVSSATVGATSSTFTWKDRVVVLPALSVQLPG